MSLSGRTATTKAMGKGSTQFQHLVQTEVPPKVLEDWLELWRKQHGVRGEAQGVSCGRTPPARELLELALIVGRARRRSTWCSPRFRTGAGSNILSVRDQNNFDAGACGRSA